MTQERLWGLSSSAAELSALDHWTDKTRLRVNKLELELDQGSHWPGLPSRPLSDRIATSVQHHMLTHA